MTWVHAAQKHITEVPPATPETALHFKEVFLIGRNYIFPLRNYKVLIAVFYGSFFHTLYKKIHIFQRKH